MELVENPRLVEDPISVARIERAKVILQQMIDTPFDQWTAKMKRIELPIELTRFMCADIVEGKIAFFEEKLPPIRRMYEIQQSGNLIHLNVGSRKVWAWVGSEILEFLNVEDAAKHFNIPVAEIERLCMYGPEFDEEIEIRIEWAD